MEKIKLTAFMLIRNEEEMIEDCLQSLSWVDEILLVIDDRTTDNSEKIARKYTDGILIRKFDGFASQANYGLEQAKNDWVLHMAADERISDELKQECVSVVTGNQEFVAFSIPYETYLLGRRFVASGFGNEQHITLFNRQYCHYSDKEIHEGLDIQGKIGTLHGKKLHYTHRTIDHLLSKIQTYSSLEAEHLMKKDMPKVTVYTLIYQTTKQFVYRYMRMQGFKDGIEGFIEAYLQATYIFVNYAKLWEKQKEFRRKS
jgi:glycosyltransferase involved in cell wall biosynthesis